MALRLMLTREEYQEIASQDILAKNRAHWNDPVAVKKEFGSTSIGFAPSVIQARQVASLCGMGMTIDEIAKVMLIDKKLLYFYYKHEIETAVAIVNTKVAHVALKMALAGDSPSSTQFWLKHRANWKETTVIEAKVEVTDATRAREKLLGRQLTEETQNELTTLIQDIDGTYSEVQP